jgi:hypothetical protein
MGDLGAEFWIGWFVAAAVVGFIASSRGKGFLGFFLLSALLSPLIGLLIALFSGDGQQRSACWQCKEQVIVGAAKCKHCGADLVWPDTPTPTP